MPSPTAAKEVPAVLGEQADEDVVTRRMQFRMKKKKKAHKQQAAAERKEEKEKKQQERLQKKQEKEQLKAEKAEQKRLAKEQKKAEKAAAKKHKGEEVQEKVEESKGQKRLHEDCTMDGNVPCETAAPDNGHFKTKGLKRAVTSKRTKRKLLTLRRGSLAKKKKTTVKSHAPKKAKRSEQAALQVQQRQAPQKKTQKNLIRGQSSKRNPIVRVSCQVPAQLPSKATQYCSTRHSRRSRTNMEPNSIESKQANRALPPRQTKKN